MSKSLLCSRRSFRMWYSISTLLTGSLFIFPVLWDERAENSVLETQGARRWLWSVSFPCTMAKEHCQGWSTFRFFFFLPMPCPGPSSQPGVPSLRYHHDYLAGQECVHKKEQRVNCKDRAILRRVLLDSEVSTSLSKLLFSVQRCIDKETIHKRPAVCPIVRLHFVASTCFSEQRLRKV